MQCTTTVRPPWHRLRLGVPLPTVLTAALNNAGTTIIPHAAGDAVLRIVAKILTDRCRKTDVVARYGGEEFLLCFPDTSSEFAEQVCAQIRAAVENADWSPISHVVGENFGITVSFGIAEIGSDSRRTTVLNGADGRLYEAKRGGRNRIVA